MNINEIKKIKLADYLQSLGYTPIKQQGRSLWYKSPLRNETDASFKVNTELNQWYDFGIGKGGNIIALAAELYHSENVAYLLERIAERTPYIRPASFSFGEQKAHNSSFQGVQVGELASPALIDYLRGRGINIELAKRECKELRFEHNGKPYFAIGFPNISGGYELLRPYTRIGSFLDNDQAGQRAYENLKKIFGNRIQDMSHHYAVHKDLNDYLCHRNQAKQAVKKSQVQSARRMPQLQPKKKRGFRL